MKSVGLKKLSVFIGIHDYMRIKKYKSILLSGGFFTAVKIKSILPQYSMNKEGK